MQLQSCIYVCGKAILCKVVMHKLPHDISTSIQLIFNDFIKKNEHYITISKMSCTHAYGQAE